jgi:hypothetical protein
MDTSHKALRAALVAAIIGALGCQSAVDVHAVQSPGAHFEQYRTVALDVTLQSPTDYAPSAQSADARTDIRESAIRVLEARGYVLAPADKADVVVRIEEGRRQRNVSVQSLAPASQAEGQTEYQAQIEPKTESLAEGAFVIDAFDGKTKQLLWEGSAHAEVTPGKVNHERLRHAVEAVLRSFPAQR